MSDTSLHQSVASWIPDRDGPLPVTSSGAGGGVAQGAPNTAANAWPVKPTDAAGVNQLAITAAGAAKVTIAGETVVVAPTVATTGGTSTYHTVSAASTNAASVKASAGQLYGWYIYNSNAVARKVALHNTGGVPTAGAGVFMSLVIPAGSAANVSLAQGIAFSNGIGITMVTGLPDSDATAVAANDLVVNLFYA